MLTARQEAFCRGVAKGLPQSRAYVEAGYDARGNAAEVEASKMVRNPKVRARLADLQAEHAKKVGKTVADIIADLDRLRDQAFANGQTAAGVAAVMGAAKILGLVVDKQQIEAIVHRPAPGPDMEKGVILSETEWEQQMRRH
jgi:phage terminase small subunit